MRLPHPSSACLVALLLTATPMLAQEAVAPLLVPAAPEQPLQPQPDAAAGLPSLPAAEAAGAQEGNILPPASPAEATAPAPQAPDAQAPLAAAPSEAGVAPAAEPPAASPATPVATPLAAPPAAPPAPPAPAVHNDLYSIVLSAHWVVLSVMALLALATFAVLVILIHKIVEYGLAFGKLRRSALALARAQSLPEAEAAVRAHRGPAAEIIRAATEEFQLAEADPSLLPGVRERTSGALARIEASAAQKLRAATGILASIGSLAPFIGLFGTVFGIMNSFLAIAESKTTNLAVVAPGIAEALFATAIGLAAAIPAVLVYNICSRKLARYRNTLGDVSAATERLQSRDLDRFAARLKAER